MKTMKALALVMLGMVAACGDGSSGNAFCDDYGAKIAGLGCAKGPGKGTLAGDCAMILDAETKCASQYQAVLTCQSTTSSCGSDGNIAFGECQTQTDAYSSCKSQ